MPVKIKGRTYKTHKSAANALRRKGWSKDRANAYVGQTERIIRQRRAAKRKRKKK